MPSPFPGMDPWLEHPQVFPDLHDRLVTYLSDALNERLPAAYHASTATRVWIAERSVGPDVRVMHSSQQSHEEGNGGVAVAGAVRAQPILVHVPHDEMREPFVEVRTLDGKRVVTSIEVLSWANRAAGGHGRDLYLRQQQELRESRVNLVEIDLLRGGSHTTLVPRERAEAKVGAFDYHVCVHRFDRWEDYEVYAWPLDQPLPVIAVPLLPGDAAVEVELQPLLNRWYDAGRYGRQLDYRVRQPVPPLAAAQQAWADGILTAAGK